MLTSDALRDELSAGTSLRKIALKYSIPKSTVHKMAKGISSMDAPGTNEKLSYNVLPNLGMNEVNEGFAGNEPELMPSTNSFGDKATNEGSELVAVPAVLPAVDCSACSRVGELSASVQKLENSLKVKADENISFLAVKEDLAKQIATLSLELENQKAKFNSLYQEGKQKLEEKRKEYLQLYKTVPTMEGRIKDLEKDKVDMSASFETSTNNLITDYEKTIKVLKRRFGDTVLVAVVIGIVAVAVIGYSIVYPIARKIFG